MTVVEIDLVRPTLHAAQQQVMDEARRFNVLQCGRRFGKTTLGVDLVIDPALDAKPTAWFAPTYKLLAEAWREIVRATKDITDRCNNQDHRLELITGGSIDGWSLDNADAGRGYKYARAVIDEAGTVKDLQEAWEQAIRPTLVALVAYPLGDAPLLLRLILNHQASNTERSGHQQRNNDNCRMQRYQ